jgi:proteasome accessory factor B
VAKVDRLLNLVAALQASSIPLTADELRVRVPGYTADNDESFRRAFERDKDDLREVGVPIETVTVEHFDQPKAAYRIRRDRYELPDPGLTPEELAALHLAATSVRLDGIGEDEVEDALRKLGGVEGSSAGGAEVAVDAPPALPALFGAVLDRQEVTFRYGEAAAERHLQPHRLQYERGRWYVSGLDVDREALRSFRLDRIVGDVEAGEADAFEPPEDLARVRLRPWEFGSGAAVTASVLLDAVVAGAVLAEDPDLRVAERREDGSVVVELDVRNADGLRGFVLSFLDRAELLGPPDLRADLVAWLTSIRDADGSSADPVPTSGGAS